MPDTGEMGALGWWAISGDDLLGMLREVAEGGDPDLVYAEHFANSDHEEVAGNLPTEQRVGHYIQVFPRGRIARHKVDRVGNDLSAQLRWCDTHGEPVWVYDDGSYECPYDRITEVHSDDHALVNAPWETPPTGFRPDDEVGG